MRDDPSGSGAPPDAAPRILLVDNHDSYTFNLHQLIWQVAGAEPHTVPNDGFDPAEVLAGGHTHLVVSPGPGSPHVPGDIGRLPELLEAFPGPVLGVCLGHQLLAALSGGKAEHAPRVMHGRVDEVAHDGRGVFAGLPQGFRCVRYHSLAVPEPLPPELQVTARASDGVLMGLRHRERPLHGVQFHPESVETEYGRELIANFLALPGRAEERSPTAQGPPERRSGAATLRSECSRDGATAPDVPGTGRNGTADPGSSAPGTADRDCAAVAAQGRPEPVRGVPGSPARDVHVRAVDLDVSPEDVFTALHAGDDHAFWLDSARTAYGMGRYSFLGSVDTRRDPLLRYSAGPGAPRLEEVRGGTARPLSGGLFDELARRTAADRVDPDAFPLPFLGGLVGYLGYGAADGTASAGPVRPDPRGPDAEFLTVRRFLAADHLTGAAWLVHSGGTAAEAAAWFDGYQERLRTVHPAPPPPPPAPQGAARATVARGDYLDDLAQVRSWLLDGESYEACYTYAMDAAAPDGPGGLLAAYRRLRRDNPAPYAAYLRSGARTVLSASPERFLEIDAHGWAESKPIKGTAARLPEPAADAEAARELASDTKTRGENLMIADLIRNDLGRVCRPGSVHVPRLMGVESYATVHQLVTSVKGRLRADRGAVDCLRALFPGGSMTGAPKERTVALLDALESRPRGPYAGCLGYLGFNGTADLSIVIRTLVCDPEGARLGTGGAITALSDPAEEHHETLLKAAAVLRCIGAEPPEDSRSGERDTSRPGHPAPGPTGA
ncbi:chorismate-binding protein [Nocardiopsis halophila]|uniref:chorismate-binding protein n=1 Tax=Nocardiopsis halophila TaxID=141692 RepID=UPI000346133A|nr:chorismate-binding protein [Nocardiopsis halophila]